MHTAILGKQAEEYVAKHLEKEGFTITAHNYRKAYGEIDIIAQRKDICVFVEVKCRTKDYFNLSEVITQQKQQKIIKTAYAFIANNKHKPLSYRFDVALVICKSTNNYDLRYIANAFAPSSNAY